MVQQCWLTTIDNPYDPFEEQDKWNIFDMLNGYNTNSYIARIALLSDQFSESEYNRAIEIAVDDILKYDFMHIYRKVYKKQTQESA